MATVDVQARPAQETLNDVKSSPDVATTAINTQSLPQLIKIASPTPDPSIAAEEVSTSKKYVPFLRPEASCKPPSAPTLTADQDTKFDALLAHVKTLTEIPVSSLKNAEKQPLNDTEKLWLTRECLLRYLRACKWSLDSAKKRLEGSLVWRREYGLYEHTADYISPENETGKECLFGFDNDCRPCLYLNPARQNTQKSPRQVQALVFFLERTIDLMPAGSETLALLIDFKSSSSSSNPSVGQGKEVLDILQNHYPERLGRALISNVPWFVWGFFKLITPFIDPLTREKLKFNEDLRHFVPPAQLDKRFGGDCDFVYDHAKYWPELDRLARERREAVLKRWEALGKPIGASEWDLKGGLRDEDALKAKEENTVDEVAESIAKIDV